jgi:hypothetical protein
MNYENRVICFIDVLGFSELIASTVDKSGEENQKNLKQVLWALNRIKQMVKGLDLDPARSKQITQFSDSIVISFLYKEESEVFHTLLSLRYLLIDLASKGILLRGGITSGKLIHTKDIVIGPAMINAYIMESKAANYPRIIVDDSIFEIAANYKRDMHSSEDELIHIGNLLGRDSDGIHYIDFIKGIYGELDEPELGYPLYLFEISKIIKKGIVHHNPSVRIKYSWLKEKYNEVVIPIKKNAETFNFEEPEAAEAYAALPVFDSIDLGKLTQSTN